jgi:deoxyguanosine kinase
MESVYLGLGTNLGDKTTNLEIAIDKISSFIGTIVMKSSIYETDPWGFESPDKFLNMVVEVKTTLNPCGVLGKLMMIEVQMGRTRKGTGYSSRVIDLDVLFYGSLVFATKGLTIPHPALPERRFVLVPLNEIAPRFVHPVLKKSIKELLDECKDTGEVRNIDPATHN